MEYFAELTDLFGGELNYSYVHRFKVKASSKRGAIGKLSREIGLHFRTAWDAGDIRVYHSKSTLSAVTLEQWEDDRHGLYTVTTI